MTKETANAIQQLSAIAALLLLGYFCRGTLRFTADSLNLIFFCVFCVIPFLAIRPVLHLQRGPRVWAWIILTPLLLGSSFLLLSRIVLGNEERTVELRTFELGSSTIQLQKYEYGGAVGVHGLNLEQRRSIVPGLYLYKCVDFFNSAQEGTLSKEGPYTVRVHAVGSYYSYDHQVDEIYQLKPWIYF
jgi:hypothetical protein